MSQPRRLFAVATVAISTIVALTLLNAALAVQSRLSAVELRRLRRDTAATLGREFDGRSRDEVRRQARARGERLVPSVVPGTLLTSARDGDQQEPIALSGIANSRTIFCNEVGEYVFYHSDQFGFRNPADAWHRPVRVAIIGDSYAQGMCVQDHESLAGRLRALGIRTLSLGFAGHGPLMELATLREYGPLVRPDIVVWALFEGNDLDRNLARDASNATLRRYVNDPGFRQGLAGRQPEVDRLWTDVINRQGVAPAQRRLPSLLGLPLVEHLRSAFENPPPADLALFERVLMRARDEVASWNGSLVVLYLPAPARFNDGLSQAQRQTLEGYRVSARQIAERLGLVFLDATPAFMEANSGGGLTYPFPAHYSPRGYETAVTPLVRWLQDRSPHPPAR